MSSTWKALPLWALVEESRQAVEPAALGDEVMHYSIPGVDATGTGHVEKSETIKSAKLLLRGGEVLVSKLNPRKSRVVHVRSSAYPMVSSTEFVGLRPSAMLDARFLGYLLQSESVRQYLDARVQSVTRSHQRVNPSDITHMSIRVPSTEEQRRIADCLDAETARIDAVAAKRREAKDLLILKRGRIIDAELGFDGRESIHDLVPLKFLVAQIVVGIVITPAKWYVENGGVPALRGLNVQPGRIIASDLVRISDEGHGENLKSRLHTGDVVVVRTGQAGAAAVVPASLDGANCVDLILVRPGSGLSPEYLEYVLNSDYVRERVSEHAVGSIQAHFNVGAMKQIPVPSISRAQQDTIVHSLDEKVGRIDQLLGMIKTQETLLAERRSALITAAVTGQIDVSTASGRGIED
jgi:type I restriction enzyme S subunit